MSSPEYTKNALTEAKLHFYSSLLCHFISYCSMFSVDFLLNLYSKIFWVYFIYFKIKADFCNSGVKLENVPVKHLSLDTWKQNGVPGALVAELVTLESAVDNVDVLGKQQLICVLLVTLFNKFQISYGQMHCLLNQQCKEDITQLGLWYDTKLYIINKHKYFKSCDRYSQIYFFIYNSF